MSWDDNDDGDQMNDENWSVEHKIVGVLCLIFADIH